MRDAIGALMARSKREIPHYYLEREIDFSRSLAWLREANLARGVNDRLLPSVLLLRAVALAVTEMPELNGFWIDGALQPADHVHLGVAISLRGGGLIAPALHDTDRKSLDDVMAGVRDLVQRARAGRLRSSEMSDPTITVTNLGDRGVDLVHGVIYPPQVALVGFGAVRERPWAVDGMLTVRPIVSRRWPPITGRATATPAAACSP
jgi:pyruvate dehydrogenase E2 component (dihydrolipoamide acetyltransferase)